MIITPAAVGHPDAVWVRRSYIAEVVGRYHGRKATATEVETVLRDYPIDDLRPPTGVFLIARERDAVVGCVGARLITPLTAELTGMFVLPKARGNGVASQLLAAAESASAELGARTMRLNTRTDLVEARRLYTRHGYVEIPPYTDQRHADHCFEKQLVSPG